MVNILQALLAQRAGVTVSNASSQTKGGNSVSLSFAGNRPSASNDGTTTGGTDGRGGSGTGTGTGTGTVQVQVQVQVQARAARAARQAAPAAAA